MPIRRKGKKEREGKEQQKLDRAAGRREALELAQARAERAGLPPEEQPQLGRVRTITTPGQLTADVAAEEKRKEILRAEGFEKETGAAQLREGIEEKIKAPPDIAPEPILERTGEAGLAIPVAAGNLLTSLAEKVTGKEFGRTTAEELAKTKAGKLLGTLTLGTGLALAVAAAAPYVATAVAKSTFFKGIVGAGGSVPLLKEAVVAVGLFTVGKSIFDFRGDEMEVMRGRIQKVVEDGERIEAANRNGFDSGDTIELLTAINQGVGEAEQRIKELGNNNIQYRVSDEYSLDQDRVRSARIALLRRITAVENIAATGVAALNPEALMFDVEQFEGGA